MVITFKFKLNQIFNFYIKLIFFFFKNSSGDSGKLKLTELGKETQKTCAF